MQRPSETNSQMNCRAEGKAECLGLFCWGTASKSSNKQTEREAGATCLGKEKQTRGFSNRMIPGKRESWKRQTTHKKNHPEPTNQPKPYQKQTTKHSPPNPKQTNKQTTPKSQQQTSPILLESYCPRANRPLQFFLVNIASKKYRILSRVSASTEIP